VPALKLNGFVAGGRVDVSCEGTVADNVVVVVVIVDVSREGTVADNVVIVVDDVDNEELSSATDDDDDDSDDSEYFQHQWTKTDKSAALDVLSRSTDEEVLLVTVHFHAVCVNCVCVCSEPL